MQRRHQKIIEEAPSPVVDAALRERMGACAVALAKAASSVGAGTVEFLVEGGEFFLMEMNTRLQVEHPVTEALTGLDLVAWQIRVARGEPLPWTQGDVRLQGHAIEVRLCAEDESFAPRTGTVGFFGAPPAAAFEVARPAAEPGVADGPRLRIDHAIEKGAEVSPFYDSMLGKLIVHAPDRQSAIDGLIRALNDTEVLGLPTNRAFLAACLDHPTFRAGQALVPFLLGAADGLRDGLRAAEEAALIPAAALTIAGSQPTSLLPCAFARPVRVLHRDKAHALAVRFDREGAAELTSGEAVHYLRPVAVAAEGGLSRWIDESVQVRIRAFQVQPGQWHVQTGSGAELWIDDLSLQSATQAGKAQAQTELRAPFNGRVIRMEAAVGACLEAGAVAVVIESMKLEHSLSTMVPVKVAEVLVEAGQQVSPGQFLLRFELVP